MHNQSLFSPNKKVRTYKCSCDKEYKVVTNKYDNSDSGRGSCECGKRETIIN